MHANLLTPQKSLHKTSFCLLSLIYSLYGFYFKLNVSEEGPNLLLNVNRGITPTPSLWQALHRWTCIRSVSLLLLLHPCATELTGELDKASATPAVCITSLKLSENQLRAAMLLRWACTLHCEFQNTRLVQVPDFKTYHITPLACQLSWKQLGHPRHLNIEVMK